MKLIISSPAGTLSFEAKKRETVIGRGDTADWVIASDRLSRSHCVVYWIKDNTRGDRFSILDPGSKNGVSVDGRRIEPNQMVPVDANSMILLANEYILTIGEKKREKTIDLSSPNVAAPVKLKTKYDKPAPAKTSGPYLKFFKKVLLVLGVILGLLVVAIFILIYR